MRSDHRDSCGNKSFAEWNASGRIDVSPRGFSRELPLQHCPLLNTQNKLSSLSSPVGIKYSFHVDQRAGRTIRSNIIMRCPISTSCGIHSRPTTVASTQRISKPCTDSCHGEAGPVAAAGPVGCVGPRESAQRKAPPSARVFVAPRGTRAPRGAACMASWVGPALTATPRGPLESVATIIALSISRGRPILERLLSTGLRGGRGRDGGQTLRLRKARSETTGREAALS